MDKLDISAFDKARNIPEVYRIARELKDEGYDENDVNALATVKKKELVSSVNKVKTLKKVTAYSTNANKPKWVSIPISINSLSRPVLEVTQDGTVIL